MGRLLPGRAPSRKILIRAADEARKDSAEKRAVIQQALLYNAALHKNLQHELCVCGHGASKHIIGSPECEVVDCSCEAFKSNWARAFENWQGEIRATLDREHGLKFLDAGLALEHPMHPTKLVEAFDGGKDAAAVVKATLEFSDVAHPAEAQEVGHP